ncbi:hypothetical protein [Streptomyces spectabilis]|uniref:DUF7848 domain-containing protein n=1 Tax=Streptomyces spectabilis TaxID=68270 RepID=UPI003F4D6BC1
MSPRSVLRDERWALEPDRELDAEPTTYAMQCVMDGETSPVSQDFADPQRWVLNHCGKHPSHHTYREVISRPWRAWRRV